MAVVAEGVVAAAAMRDVTVEEAATVVTEVETEAAVPVPVAVAVAVAVAVVGAAVLGPAQPAQ